MTEPIFKLTMCIGFFAQCERCEMWVMVTHKDQTGNIIHPKDLEKVSESQLIQQSAEIYLAGGKYVCLRCFNETNGGLTIDKAERVKLR